MLIGCAAGLSLTGYLGWGPSLLGVTGIIVVPNANAAVNVGRSSAQLINGRFRPYRSQALGYNGRNFDRDWNDKENSRVPMRVNTKRFRLGMMLPRDPMYAPAIANGLGG